jgi:hypothetical protein
VIIKEVTGTAWYRESAARDSAGWLPGRRGGRMRRQHGEPGTLPVCAIAVGGGQHSRAG